MGGDKGEYLCWQRLDGRGASERLIEDGSGRWSRMNSATVHVVWLRRCVGGCLLCLARLLLTAVNHRQWKHTAAVHPAEPQLCPAIRRGVRY